MRNSMRKIVRVEHTVRRRYDERVRFFWDHAYAILGEKYDSWVADLQVGDAAAWAIVHNNALLSDLHNECRRYEVVLLHREIFK